MSKYQDTEFPAITYYRKYLQREITLEEWRNIALKDIQPKTIKSVEKKKWWQFWRKS